MEPEKLVKSRFVWKSKDLVFVKKGDVPKPEAEIPKEPTRKKAGYRFNSKLKKPVK